MAKKKAARSKKKPAKKVLGKKSMKRTRGGAAVDYYSPISSKVGTSSAKVSPSARYVKIE